MIAGFADQDRMGRTAFAGPLVKRDNNERSSNRIARYSRTTADSTKAVLAGAAINAFLAVFNLIPFAVFDGRKVYAWNRVYWAAPVPSFASADDLCELAFLEVRFS